MLEIQKKFNQFCRRIMLVMLAIFVVLMSLPVNPAQAEGYFSEKARRPEATRLYYANKDHRVAEDHQGSRPYYSEKQRLRATNPRVAEDNSPYYKKLIGEDKPRDLKPAERRTNLER